MLYSPRCCHYIKWIMNRNISTYVVSIFGLVGDLGLIDITKPDGTPGYYGGFKQLTTVKEMRELLKCTGWYTKCEEGHPTIGQLIPTRRGIVPVKVAIVDMKNGNTHEDRLQLLNTWMLVGQTVEAQRRANFPTEYVTGGDLTPETGLIYVGSKLTLMETMKLMTKLNEGPSYNELIANDALMHKFFGTEEDIAAVRDMWGVGPKRGNSTNMSLEDVNAVVEAVRRQRQG
jgi:hypothetical protein